MRVYKWERGRDNDDYGDICLFTHFSYPVKTKSRICLDRPGSDKKNAHTRMSTSERKTEQSDSYQNISSYIRCDLYVVVIVSYIALRFIVLI